MKESSKWIFYNLIIGFSFYWASNLLLWFPWSINTNLGIAMMLTVAPLLWGIGVYNCLIRYQGKNLIRGAIINSVLLLVIAAILDYVFFGIIRKAIKELYHPTTFYGYAFLVSLPFVEFLLFKKLIHQKRKKLVSSDFIKIGILGLMTLIILVAIIKFDITI